MSKRKWFRLCTKIKYHALENTPKILIWQILHGRCFPAKPVAFHWALPAEPYHPQHQNVGPTSFFSTISPFISLLNPCWRLYGSHQLTCKCPFQKRFLCAAFLWTVGRGDIQGVKGVPPECGSSVMLWHSSFSLGGVLHFRTHFWSSFPKNYNPNVYLVSFIQSFNQCRSWGHFLLFFRAIFLPGLFHFYCCRGNALLLQRWVTESDADLRSVCQFLQSACVCYR